MKLTTVTIGIFLVLIFWFGCDVTFQFHIEGSNPSTTTFEKNHFIAWVMIFATILYLVPEKYTRRFAAWLKGKFKPKKTLADRIEEESHYEGGD